MTSNTDEPVTFDANVKLVYGIDGYEAPSAIHVVEPWTERRMPDQSSPRLNTEIKHHWDCTPRRQIMARENDVEAVPFSLPAH